jgi:hypothetical protein
MQSVPYNNLGLAFRILSKSTSSPSMIFIPHVWQRHRSKFFALGSIEVLKIASTTNHPLNFLVMAHRFESFRAYYNTMLQRADSVS